MKLHVFLALLTLLVSTSLVLAQSSTTLFSTVKVSVCGNGVVESPAEDCEGTDLSNSSCASLGYDGGDLSCDISCSYDTTTCTLSTPTPTPVPTPSSSIAPITSTIPSPLLPLVSSNQTPSIPLTIVNLLNSLSLPTTGLTESNFNTAIKGWVDSWRAPEVQDKTLCDINGDSNCNLVDLSVLFFYFKR